MAKIPPLLEDSAGVTAALYYLGRTLQVSGLVLGFLVIILFFNPENGEGRLLTMTLVAAGVFFGGHFLMRMTGSRE